jgi:vacuolar-type H+-ATPase subunit I/STV1
MDTIEEMKSKADALWDELQALAAPYRAKRQKWHAALTAYEEAERREKVRAELLAEQAKGTEAKP